MNELQKQTRNGKNGGRTRNSVLRQLATLQNMTLEQLREKWLDLYGSDPPRYKKQFLVKRLAYRIQELFYGGLSETAKTRLRQIAREKGFEYDGRIFRSLSAVAREITGTRWNGKVFFGLNKTYGKKNGGGKNA
ncbi:MAG: DUF2924 domain-containing protein [Deltaproteobacteria bacterium]|nr:MAG: DUF2924 domain-containing protein [Deltaproteobacteria bacterium]